MVRSPPGDEAPSRDRVAVEHQVEFIWNTRGARDRQTAPPNERLRTVQSIVVPSGRNEMTPPFSTRVRGVVLFSTIGLLTIYRVIYRVEHTPNGYVLPKLITETAYATTRNR